MRASLPPPTAKTLPPGPHATAFPAWAHLGTTPGHSPTPLHPPQATLLRAALLLVDLDPDCVHELVQVVPAQMRALFLPYEHMV